MSPTVLAEPTIPVERPPAHERRGSGGGPPFDGDDGDEGGGGGGGEGPGRDDFPFRPGKLAMAFVLFSLSVLFLVTLAATLVLRKGATAAAWPPHGSPRFPGILWANTVVLLASSGFLRAGVRAIGHGAASTLRWTLGVTTVLGVLFLVGQLDAWLLYVHAGETMATGSHGVVFYWLTGLHGAHVVGGIVFLLVCFANALRGRYTQAQHLGVELCELYWHFLGIVWIVLVVTLFWVL